METKEQWLERLKVAIEKEDFKEIFKINIDFQFKWIANEKSNSLQE